MELVDNFVEIREIAPHIAQYIADKKMYVLRDGRNQMAMDVSHTEEGLKFAANYLGKPLLFQNGAFQKVIDVDKTIEKGENVISHIKIVSVDGKPLKANPRYYVELFVPRNHSTKRAQVAECMCIDKAYRLSHLDGKPFEA